MNPPPAVVILDLDGVLVDLHLDGQRVRRELNEILAGHGLSVEGQGLMAGIEVACASVSLHDPPAGAQLAERLWAVIDEEEARRASTCAIHPGAALLLQRLSGLPVALFTNNHRACALAALQKVGIDANRFFSIQARPGAASIKPSAAPILALLSAPEAAGAERAFFVGDHPADMGSALAARPSLPGVDLVAIGHAHRMEDVPRLEAAGADFVVTEVSEAAELIRAPRSPHSLSLVLLAWNEEDSIVAAIRDCRRFGRLWLSSYEIIVVDDGSRDATASRAEAASEGDVRVVRHACNQGMGAAMRDGYAAARCDYIAHLPADRQVRPQSLLAFLPQISPETTVVSTYVVPPSGEQRRWMSLAFRLIVRGLGGLRVNFAGTYVFHRRWLESIDPASVQSHTFVYSFELLERLRRAGSHFAAVTIRPFMREVGQSREVALQRILRVFGEIARYRARDVVRGSSRATGDKCQ
jgi:phosphoglycolate phosphatase-like HAD superfamily hydrolase